MDEAKLREDALKAQVLSFEKENGALKEQKKSVRPVVRAVNLPTLSFHQGQHDLNDIYFLTAPSRC